MKYRTNRKTGDRISEIGMGSAWITETERNEAIQTIRAAYEGGVNYFDLAAGDGAAFALFHEALGDVRDKVFYQIHFGADYTGGTYGWKLDLKTVKKSVAWMMEQLHTDYIDYGFIHCQDEFSDWETFRENGIYDFLMRLKERGIVRHTGCSSHTPKVLMKILDETDLDMVMFSVNPAYERGSGEYARGDVEERSRLYRRCEAEGIGISVMKPFSGGQLLRADLSPFHKSLSPYQCIRYALDRPGVLTVLPGMKSVREAEELLAYYAQSPEQLDYSEVDTFTSADTFGRCIYCNHCRPCPVGIDIGAVNKFYDLACLGDPLAKEHYYALEKTAADCIGCEHCDDRCPFDVIQSERMSVIREFMGR
ncbi:MAG: aldo/keto reductase [Solobacterium sp.]|nr:aldo/keto reductase [Solobacterium sp.]